MFNKDNLGKSAAAALLAIMTSQAAISADNPMPANEKCYGVAKAGLNDCATAKASCAGSATSDNQSDAFLLMPKGLCEKLVGGSLSIKK